MTTENSQQQRRTVICRYTGPATGERNACATCGPKWSLKKFTCLAKERKGEVVTWADCQKCPHYKVAGLTDAEMQQPAQAESSKPSEEKELEPVVPAGTPEKDRDDRAGNFKQKIEKLVIINRLAPGDCLVLTGVIESLAACYPGRFEITTLTTSPDVFEHNPHIHENLLLRGGHDFKVPKDATIIDVNCHLLPEWNNRPLHVLEAFLDFFRCSLKLPRLFLTTNRPKLHFSAEEEAQQPLVWQKPYFNRPTRYWLINAGVKADIRAKLWNGYQEVVNRLQGQVIFVQVGRTCDEHPHLTGVLDMIGKTDLRQLLNMVRHCDGVLSGISMLMHAAAALAKPAVIVGGGLEGKSWNTYPEQTYLDTIGRLDCCKHGGCGRGVIVQRNDVPIDPRMNLGVCLRPLPTSPPVGACMGMIQPATVAEAVRAYYAGGVLQAGMVGG